MSTFADFALLAAVPSYGGAEILRAQRILPMGPGPRVHLAILGRNDSVARRIIAAAHAGSAVLHPSLARIFEVCRFDGVSYAVGDPSEGLDLSALLSRSRRPLPYELALAVAAMLGRVGVALHDAGGPGSRGGPAGFASVVSGGLGLEVVFLETTGAVRLRPLSAAGIDPDVPSALRAPEEAISMAADVYSLGRLLMAMLSGDASGLTMPRLSASSPMATLLAQMVQRRPEQRPHLHDAITRLEQALRERNISAADQAVRAALQGPYKQFVVDPGLALDASPHIIHELRVRLPYVYGAIERLWPSVNPGFAPAPPVFAALAAPPVPLLGNGGTDDDDDDAPVFSDQKPKRRRPRTAATLRIDANEMAAAVAAADAAGPLVEEQPKRRSSRPTVKTVIIPTAEMIKGLPNGGATPSDDDDDGAFDNSGIAGRAASSRPQHTVLFDEGFSPFAPPPPQAAPVPFHEDLDDDDPGGPTRELELSPPSVFSAPPPPSPPPAPAKRPPRPPTLAALAVFDNGDDDIDDADDDPELAPIEGSLFQRLQAAEAAEAAAATRAMPSRAPSSPPAAAVPSRRQAPTIDAAVDPRDLLRSVLDDDDLSDDDNGAIDASDEDDAGFLSRSPQRPVSTVVGPAPQLSDPGSPSGATVPRPAVPPSTIAEDVAFAPPPSVPVADEGDFAAAFAFAFVADPPAATRNDSDNDDDEQTALPAPVPSSEPPLLDDLEEIEEVEAIEDEPPELIDDAASFVMVGEAGAAFAPEHNPFDQSTRIYAAQALQQARNELDDEEGTGDDVVDDLDLDGDLDADIDAALAGALPFSEPAGDAINDDDDVIGDSPWATPGSLTGPAQPSAFEPRTELVEAGAWNAPSEVPPPHVVPESAQVAVAPKPYASPFAALAPSLAPQTMVSTSPLRSEVEAPRTTVGSLGEQEAVLDSAVPRNVTGVYTPPRGASATSELVVEAVVGATVALNGTVVGTVVEGGRFGVEVAGDARVVVRVTLPGHAPWSSVVTVQGRPRVRVKATLQPR